MKMLDKSSTVPLYQQVKEIIQEAIFSKEYPEGSKLPAEHQFCQMLGVSRITIIKAFDLLEQEGMVYRVQGKGSFVATQKVSRDLSRLSSFSAALREQGYHPVSKVICKEFVRATPKLNALFKRPADSHEDFVRIKRLRYVNETPMGISTSISAIEFGAGISLEALEGSMYDLLRAKYGTELYRMDETLSVKVAGEEESSLLGIPKGFPMFVTESISYVQGNDKPIEVSSSVFRGDKIKFHADVVNMLVLTEQNDNKKE